MTFKILQIFQTKTAGSCFYWVLVPHSAGSSLYVHQGETPQEAILSALGLESKYPPIHLLLSSWSWVGTEEPLATITIYSYPNVRKKSDAFFYVVMDSPLRAEDGTSVEFQGKGESLEEAIYSLFANVESRRALVTLPQREV